MITKNYKGWRITAGFLSGNWDAKIYADATAEKWRKALSDEFPGVCIDIRYQYGEGATPHFLKLRVFDPDGNCQEGGFNDTEWRKASLVLEEIEPVWMPD